jgi:fluoroquinolone transport system ATP-binding protein
MIRAENLSYTYLGTTSPAVTGLDFHIAPGEIFGFLGPSGAGKSTTQKILIGLLKDFKGEANVLGKSIRDWGSDLYERIGVSFEVPNLYGKLTGVENLAYFGSLYSGPVRSPAELIEAVGLDPEDGALLVSQYSKGMRNRLNVARSMLHDPDLLFMDEPTAGLDPVNARRVKELIKGRREAGKTVFLTTHDMTVADELCDRVAFIVDGRISRIDSPQELKLQYGSRTVRVEFLENGAVRRADFPLDGLGEDGEFLKLVRGAEIRTIHTQEATLEEIFIQVTGRSLAG